MASKGPEYGVRCAWVTLEARALWQRPRLSPRRKRKEGREREEGGKGRKEGKGGRRERGIGGWLLSGSRSLINYIQWPHIFALGGH